MTQNSYLSEIDTVNAISNLIKMIVGAYLQVVRRVHHMDRLNPILDFILVFLLTCFIFTLPSVLLLPMHAGFRLLLFPFATILLQKSIFQNAQKSRDAYDQSLGHYPLDS
jgi:hypothetical protein